VHDITLAIGPLVCNILPAAHALTGCDTTSSFFGIGKKTVYKTSIQNPQKFQNLLSLTWRVMWLNFDNVNLKSTTGPHIHPLSVQVSQLFKTLDLNSMVMVQISSDPFSLTLHYG
jgi:hypothetical protein